MYTVIIFLTLVEIWAFIMNCVLRTSGSFFNFANPIIFVMIIRYTLEPNYSSANPNPTSAFEKYSYRSLAILYLYILYIYIFKYFLQPNVIWTFYNVISLNIKIKNHIGSFYFYNLFVGEKVQKLYILWECHCI